MTNLQSCTKASPFLCSSLNAQICAINTVPNFSTWRANVRKRNHSRSGDEEFVDSEEMGSTLMSSEFSGWRER